MSWRIFDAWVSALERPPHGVVVGSDDISADAVLLVASQLADTDALRFSWGIRLLSPIAWVDVATLSPFGAMDGRRPVFGISQGDCVNEAVRRAQASSSSRLPSVDSLRARDVEPVEVRASGKAGPRRQVSGELDLHARAALRRRKLLLGIAALIVAACSLSAALYFAFSRPKSGGLGEQVFVSSGGGGAPFLPTPNESTRPDTPPSSTTVSGSEAEKSTSPDPAETGASRIALVPPKGTAEPSPSPTTDLVPVTDPVLPPPPPPLTPPPPPPPVDQPPAAEPQQPLLDLSQEDKRKVRGMIEWSTKVRGIQGVWDTVIYPLFVELTKVIGEYNTYVQADKLWKKQNHLNPSTAGSAPREPEFLQNFPEWEARWLTAAEDAVQRLGLSQNSQKLTLDPDVGKRYRSLVQVRESDENQMSFVAEVMCCFIGVSTVYDLQSHAPPNDSGWQSDFEKKRKTQLFKTPPFVGAEAKIDSIYEFIKLRTDLLNLTKVSVDAAARNFFLNDKKLARFKSFGDLYVEISGSMLPGNTFEQEFKNLLQEIDDLLNAFPAP
jgi:hypothetical protein